MNNLGDPTLGGKALAQVAQRGVGYPTPGDIQGQAGGTLSIYLWVSLFTEGEFDQNNPMIH